MLRHIILFGEDGLRDYEITSNRTLRKLIPSGVPRFDSLGIRTPRAAQEVRTFWSIPDHESVVRLVEDTEMGVLMASVDTLDAKLGEQIAAALAAELPSVPLEEMLSDESRFDEVPDLIFLLALAARNDADDRVLALVRRLLLSDNENARVSAAGAAVVLDKLELLEALKEAATRKDNTPAAKRVFDNAIVDLENHKAAHRRTEPFKDPEETFKVVW
ncbi:MAG: hypothetical protein QM784_22840 [Polyangiaceae bacterium]